MLATLMISTVIQAKPESRDCSKSEAQIDTFIKDLEKSLPVFEKQAEVIIKLLNSDQHRAKMIKDLDEIKNMSPFGGDSTHLYKAMKSFKLEQDLLFELDSQYAMPFYDTEFLAWLTHGGCYPRSYNNSLYDITPEQWLKMAEIMDKILGILTPLQTVVSEKISLDDIGDLGQGGIGCTKNRPHPMCLYSFMFPLNGDNGAVLTPDFNKNALDGTRKAIEEAKTPPAHLEMMKKYFEYLSQRRTFRTVNFDWVSAIANIDKLLSELAESGNLFQDLENVSAEDSSAGSAKEDSGDLNFDDLKLPQ
jgi:hypothetical protein